MPGLFFKIGIIVHSTRLGLFVESSTIYLADKLLVKFHKRARIFEFSSMHKGSDQFTHVGLVI